eukprot:COSAG02_NODE_60101_length_272_cov_0.601156_1_plen_28_part_10
METGGLVGDAQSVLVKEEAAATGAGGPT